MVPEGLDYGSLTNQELEAIRQAVTSEIQARTRVVEEERYRLEQLSKAKAVIQTHVRLYLDARDGEYDPDNPNEWVRPTGAHDAYPIDRAVSFDGHIWDNLVDGNVYTPGESGWRMRSQPNQPAIWVQPTGAHDAYSFGDVVLHISKTWRNDHPGNNTNVWEPGHFSGWTELQD